MSNRSEEDEDEVPNQVTNGTYDATRRANIDLKIKQNPGQVYIDQEEPMSEEKENLMRNIK